MMSTLRRERRKIERNLSGIREMSSIPGAMVVVDPGREANAVREARRLGVPVIGVLDTDCDPTLCDIVIPGNDDALRSVRLLVDRLVKSVEEGCAHRREQVAATGERDKPEDMPMGDEPRPTRGNKPPIMLRPRRGATPALPGLPTVAEEELSGDEDVGATANEPVAAPANEVNEG
jgi:small subunit ribosomal protein S2